MYEHPVPVSPFEETRSASDTISKNNSNMNMEEDLQKTTSEVKIGKSNIDNDIASIGGGQMRKVPFRTFRA